MKLRLLALALLVCGGAAAQNPYIALQGRMKPGGIVVSQPRTVLAVDVTAERDVTLRAPMRVMRRNTSGCALRWPTRCHGPLRGLPVALLDPKACLDAPAPRPAFAHGDIPCHVRGIFARLQADKNDMAVLALGGRRPRSRQHDLFASQAPDRTHHGRSRENVFGEGLKAALAEIDRMEQSYLELFLGKRIVSTETRRYVVYPQADKKQYIVCRFSPAAGLLPDSDLSGDIVLLQIEPSGNTATAVEASAKESNTVACRVADPSVCTVIAGGREYARAVLPLFEFGRTINVALPRRK